MKPIYSRDINVQLMPYNDTRQEWMLCFFDVDQDFVMMYICTEDELLTLSDRMREDILETIRLRGKED